MLKAVLAVSATAVLLTACGNNERSEAPVEGPADKANLAAEWTAAGNLKASASMSGPAGGVTGALWVAVQAGFPNLLTVDVGGTSTDVNLRVRAADADFIRNVCGFEPGGVSPQALRAASRSACAPVR